MKTNPFYVYALKDPRSNPAQIFYVGKGTGFRMENHLDDKSDSDKTVTIKSIAESGHEVIIEKLVDDLTEVQALKIEAELIAAFGVKSNGGLLTNKVSPSNTKSHKAVKNVPVGCYEKSQGGLDLIKQAVLEFIKANPSGVTNGDVSKYLGLQADYLGGSINYLSYNILGLLMRDNLVLKDGRLHKYSDNMKANKSMHRTR